MTDLWPETIGTVRVKSPVAILREQASLLGQKTQNLVQAQVKGGPADPRTFLYFFQIVVPALDYYKYELFTINHDIAFYPLTIFLEEDICIELEKSSTLSPWQKTAEDAFKIETEDEFLEALKIIFGSEKTKRIVTALLSQLDSNWGANDYGLSASESNPNVKADGENMPLAS